MSAIDTTAIVLLVLTLACAGGFLALYRFRRFSICCGMAFCALLCCIFAFALLAISNDPSSPLSIGLVVLVLLLVAVPAMLGGYVVIVFLFVNAAVVRRHESVSLANNLTLLAGCLLLALTLCLALLSPVAQSMPPLAFRLFSAFEKTLGTNVVLGLCFLATALLYPRLKPRRNRDYLVVLGCGLRGGEVPPLLAARVNAALAFAERQLKEAGRAPVIVMSGGQGTDEQRPEAAAMCEYARNCGYSGRILVEDASRSTAENMRFSRELIAADWASGDANRPRVSFVTSNYHLVRAAIFANRVFPGASGIGARTARYFWPNAILREYLAYIYMNKWVYAAIVALIFATDILMP
jgi:uncharacterized SAM-binding protein YcdF (DUF218 family)